MYVFSVDIVVCSLFTMLVEGVQGRSCYLADTSYLSRQIPPQLLQFATYRILGRSWHYTDRRPHSSGNKLHKQKYKRPVIMLILGLQQYMSKHIACRYAFALVWTQEIGMLYAPSVTTVSAKCLPCESVASSRWTHYLLIEQHTLHNTLLGPGTLGVQ